MSRVLNKSTQLVEPAKYVKCPRCSGFGGIITDEHRCTICDGFGKVWRSVSGWTRVWHRRLETSKLW